MLVESVITVGAAAQKRGKNRWAESRAEEERAALLPIPKFQNQSLKAEYLRRFSKYIYRSDYIIIWGDGHKYKNQIIDMIQAHKDFSIIEILYHRPRSVRKLAKAVYSCDYAPFNHLKSKIRCLKKPPKEVLFIFIENWNPQEDYFGEGIFRRLESGTLRAFKEKIRNKFNDEIDVERAEEHLIDVSANELQTHYVLQYIGFDGVDYLKRRHAIIDLPHHVKHNSEFVIKNISIDSLYCNLIAGDSNGFVKEKRVHIKLSPHYRALIKDDKIYRNYIDNSIGRALMDDYYWEKFRNLAQDFKYLAAPYSRSYIAVRQFDTDEYAIIDGLHRAAIMCYQGVKELAVAVLKGYKRC